MTDLLAQYADLREKGTEATRIGNLQEAKIHFRAAMAIAQNTADPKIEERAFCNVALIDIELGEATDSLIPRLRNIVVSNICDENCRLAAYHLARIYDLRHEHKKGLFYARIALERSVRLGNQAWEASSCNQMGNLLIGECQFEDAECHLKRALDLMPGTDSVPLALLLDNMGYCHLVQEDITDGFRHLFRGLRMLRRLRAHGRVHELHLSLSFGYLEIGRWVRAARHGAKALELAETQGDSNAVKNALFLLGEAFNQAGDMEQARRQFEHLQEDFFPEHHFLPDFLLGVDIRGLVNLKA